MLHFSRLAATRMSPFCISLELRMIEMVVTTEAISVKLQWNLHHQQTNTQHVTGRMPFLSPNQQCQSTEGKISHRMDLLTPSSPGGLLTLSLTTNSSWLPWGRVAMPLISPLMPVPQTLIFCLSRLIFCRSLQVKLGPKRPPTENCWELQKQDFFLRAKCLSCCPTNSIRALKAIN